MKTINEIVNCFLLLKLMNLYFFYSDVAFKMVIMPYCVNFLYNFLINFF